MKLNYKSLMGIDKKKNPIKKEQIEVEPKVTVLDDLKEELGYVNETLPALGREYDNYSKARKLYLKSVVDLEKAAGKVDRTFGKQISTVWKKTISNNMKKFDDALNDVLSKLQ
jgi:phage-related minor tail protein